MIPLIAPLAPTSGELVTPVITANDPAANDP
jgi:hypothetical protein